MRFFWPLDLPPKLIQFLCDFSGLWSLARKGPRRQIAERRVRPSGIVVVPPTFEPGSGVVHRSEPRGIQALGPEARIARRDRRMIRGLAGSREVEFDVVPVRPLIQDPPGKLRASVTPDGVGLAPGLHEAIQDLHHLLRPKARARARGQALTTMTIHSRQDPKGTPVVQAVRHKIHRPAVIGTLNRRTTRPVTGRTPPAWRLGADAQAFFFVEAIDSLGIDRPALPPKQHMQATRPVPDSGRRQFLEPQPQLVLRIGRGPVAV